MRSFHASQHPPRGHGRTETHCPEFHRGLPSVHEYVAATRYYVIRCPIFHRDLPSVAASARSGRNSLPGISPRLAFVCRTSAAGQKLIVRNFNAPLLRCMELSRLPVIRCPIFHRGLPSVVASAQSQPDANPFPLLSVACI